jgi:hypothetical protein
LTRAIPLRHPYSAGTAPEEMRRRGNVTLGFDAKERMIRKPPQDFADKVLRGLRCPHRDASDAIAENAARQFGVGFAHGPG